MYVKTLSTCLPYSISGPSNIAHYVPKLDPFHNMANRHYVFGTLGTASVCLQNLRKTLRYGGRKNVPSVEEVTAVSAGRNSKRQMYRLPGGSETVINTKSTTVVDDIITEMCALINVNNPLEMEEFSLYCIVEGDAFTMPLAREEYILDVTTELQKNQQVSGLWDTLNTQFSFSPARIR